MTRTIAACAALIILSCAGCKSIGNWLEGEPKSVEEWKAAEKLFNDERYVEAGVAYRAWLADYHDSRDVLRPHVMFKLGETYRLTQNQEKAIATYTALIEMYSESEHPAVRELINTVARPRLDEVKPKTSLEPTPE